MSEKSEVGKPSLTSSFNTQRSGSGLVIILTLKDGF